MDKIKVFLRQLWFRFRGRMMRFMQGRRGADELGLACLLAGAVFVMLGSLFGSGLMYFLGFAFEIYALFRMLSRQVLKRAQENTAFLTWYRTRKRDTKAFFLRLKLRKQYKYFRCPGCRSLMRLSRGRGEVEMTCPKCHTVFKQKA